MFSMFLVYAFLTIPTLATMFGIITGIACAVVLVTVMWLGLEYGLKEAQIAKGVKLIKTFIAVAVSSGLICTLIPSKETSYAMAAAYVAQEAVQSELGQSALQLLQANINEALASLKGK